MYKKIYSRFLNAHPNELHFACHSHHYWPDVTREAQIQYWDDSCKYVDDKWSHFFSQKVPQVQKLIAENLHTTHPEQLVFAQSTHEFVFRLLSSLNWQKKIRILTTDSEFYSFDRQVNRLSELGNFEVVKIPTLPFATFEQRFSEAMKQGPWDLIFISHVFFNSGVACDVAKLAQAAPPEPLFVIDGYHGFMAVPLDFTRIQERAFYVAGAYKYAQGGEGACFLYVPPSTRHRPFYTGWFAELSKLSAVGNQVGYPSDALQYAGSTMDFSALYRLQATLELFKKEGLSVESIHAFVQQNQSLFLAELDKASHALLNKKTLLSQDLNNHGHFLTFDLPSTEMTQAWVKGLASRGVKTDSRGTRLRFGFGLYHEAEDIRKVINTITSLTI
ncbi:MAG TPA: aminotransferase class V-fold PLP-dependent enzyme [Bdellovibrio sp.]